MSSVTASASRTTTASPLALRVPPLGEHADARFEAQRAGHRTAVGGRAGAVAVDAAHHEVAVRGRLDRRALRRLHPRLERDPPGRLAVSRTTMTWSGALANTSRENVTPPLV